MYVFYSSPNSTDRVILCRGEQHAILSCLRDIFTQIEKIPPRGPIRPCKKNISPIEIYLRMFTDLDDPSCYVENQIQGYGKSNIFEIEKY